ncbi:MAG: CopD family protein [Gammaproteobacteria bacterium]|nr:MAG: CopD family protein [Gammaproteobacteria bacterium]
MLWIKALHVIFMVTWFAGLFYLPRLFVYHADCQDQPGHERFVVMERKLFAIMTIGALLTALFGVWLIAAWHWPVTEIWLQIKLILVAALIAYHLYCGALVRRFKLQQNTRSGVFYRWFNEFPALVLIAVVLLAVLRPA